MVAAALAPLVSSGVAHPHVAGARLAPHVQTRRSALAGAAALSVGIGLLPSPRAMAAPVVPGGTADDFGELPQPSVRAYKQFRPSLQYAGDYYLFELHELVSDVSNWPDLAKLLTSTSANGQGQPSELARTMLLPMQQIALAFPPELGEELEGARGVLEKELQAMIRVTRLTNNAVATGASKQQLSEVEAAWQRGRTALNRYYELVNSAVGPAQALQAIPTSEAGTYPRTKQRYIAFRKGLKVCQNRGGTNLAGVWGGLMVYGTAVDPCGDMPDVETYLYGAPMA